MSKYDFDISKHETKLISVLNEIAECNKWSGYRLAEILRKYPMTKDLLFSKDQLLAGYRELKTTGKIKFNEEIESRLRTKPIRTLSGVAPVTVLMKYHPCPGGCIFCPNDKGMPKSYLINEPGAQRAIANEFDPYKQVFNRLVALDRIGHSTDKVELIVLGGTWSVYPEEYQRWFVKRCFEAMNDFQDGADVINEVPLQKETAEWNEIFSQHKINENAHSRCVGFSVETRPDYITVDECIEMRKFGVTKVQIGVQFLDEKILKLNGRGHDISAVKNAFDLLRKFGFKIQIHWMANLYGSTPKQDIADYAKLWKPEFCPDELKVYPTSIIKNTGLYQLYLEGKYEPYSENELKTVLKSVMKATPRFCRLSRVIRDISSVDIVAGNKVSNLREMVESELKDEGAPCNCIRCREVRNEKFTWDNLAEEVIKYDVCSGEEYFISFKLKDNDKIAGFLRLFLPNKNASAKHPVDELQNSSVIREIHVYGELASLGKKSSNLTQHRGIGAQLITLAENYSRRAGFNVINVISAIGTRDYYRKRGFELGNLYMKKSL